MLRCEVGGVRSSSGAAVWVKRVVLFAVTLIESSSLFHGRGDSWVAAPEAGRNPFKPRDCFHGGFPPSCRSHEAI